MRHAIYFTPPADHPLTVKANQWLGRDAFTGLQVQQPMPGMLSQPLQMHYTRSPRRYGFHATIVAPFRLNANINEDGLKAALVNFCDERAAFDLPDMEIRELGPFFALMPAEPPEELTILESDAVEFFHYLRQPPTEEEFEKRKKSGLSDRQQELLERWGYPYVKDQFRFHMTLTGEVPAEDRLVVRAALEAHFDGLLGKPLALDRLAIFEEKTAGGPFKVTCTRQFQSEPTRKIA